MNEKREWVCGFKSNKNSESLDRPPANNQIHKQAMHQNECGYDNRTGMSGKLPPMYASRLVHNCHGGITIHSPCNHEFHAFMHTSRLCNSWRSTQISGPSVAGIQLRPVPIARIINDLNLAPLLLHSLSMSNIIISTSVPL